MESREHLVKIALEWERLKGIAPSITSALSEFDAAILIGVKPEEFKKCREGMTAVTKGYDFIWQGKKYQVKANRPSGKSGSFVTLVSKPKNLDWDYLIWILYDRNYEIEEAWLCDVETFKVKYESKKQLRPQDIRYLGTCIFRNNCIQKENIKEKTPGREMINKMSTLSRIERKDLLKKFMSGKLDKKDYVNYCKTRLYFDKKEISKLNKPEGIIIIEIQPTEKSKQNGYEDGYFIMTKQEFENIFSHILDRKSWLQYGNFHYPTPPSKADCLYFSLEEMK